MSRNANDRSRARAARRLNRRLKILVGVAFLLFCISLLMIYRESWLLWALLLVPVFLCEEWLGHKIHRGEPRSESEFVTIGLETPQIDPPIVVSESGEVDTFESVEAAESYLEPIDVEEERYIAYDSRGRLLQLTATSPRITIKSAEKDGSHQGELQSLLRKHLESVGADGRWVLHASLPELVAKSLEYRVVAVSPLAQLKTRLKRIFKPRP